MPEPARRRSPGARVEARRFRALVYAAVRRIPRGQVATYGDVARAIGRPRAARAVGRALADLSAPMARAVPWHRVVNAGGGISRRDPESMALQRERLELEGVRLRRGRVEAIHAGRPGRAGAAVAVHPREASFTPRRAAALRRFAGRGEGPGAR